MFGKLKKIVRRVTRPEPKELTITWVRESKDSWLRGWLGERSVAPPVDSRSCLIERLADATDDLGPKRIWERYADDSRGRWRQPDAVRTDRMMGNLFSALVVAKRPNVVVEFGTAFGVSGMYWLAGLKKAQRGTLYTFDPNAEWAQIARHKLERVGRHFVQVVGTFKEHVDRTLPLAAAIAFIAATVELGGGSAGWRYWCSFALIVWQGGDDVPNQPWPATCSLYDNSGDNLLALVTVDGLSAQGFIGPWHCAQTVL